MKQLKQFVFVLFVVQSMLSATGCSAIGFGIGAASDSNKINRQEFSGEELTRIPKNSQIQIFLKNGLVQKGHFIRLVEQQVGEEFVNSIVWNNSATYRQESTQISAIERVVIKPEQNMKWFGLFIGGVLDASIIGYIICCSGLSFFPGS